MSSFTIHNDFNELEFSADSSLKDLFDKVTRDVFGDRLLFAIIETTTIGNESGVGTTQYIAYKGDKYIQDVIHKEYFDIIKTIKETEFGGPSKYYDWYKRSQFYYAIGTNNSSFQPTDTSSILNSKILDPYKKDWSAVQYISDYETKLSDSAIRTFFTQYVNCFLKKDWFKELPEYFILVKPISIQDETGLYIPLGNLYLKIGTSQKMELKEYKKYVSLLQAAWFNKFGAKILKEYSKKKISDEYKPKLDEHPNLKKKFQEKLFTVNGVEITFNDFYYYAFDLDNFQSYREQDQFLIYSGHNLIESIIHRDPNKKEELIEFIKSSFNGFSTTDPINFIQKNKKALKATNSISDIGIKYFLQLLSKRRFALMLLYVYGLTEDEAHKCITFGDRGGNRDVNSATVYLRENLFIYPGGFEFNNKLLADRERLFLEKVTAKIKSKHHNFTCNNFS